MSNMSVNVNNTYGFGVPCRARHYFVVTIKRGYTLVMEYLAKQGISKKQYVVPKCIIPQKYWDAMAPVLESEFNQRLEKKNLPKCSWSQGDNFVDSPFGKELCVLARAIQASGKPEKEIREWIGSTPEERWSRF